MGGKGHLRSWARPQRKKSGMCLEDAIAEAQGMFGLNCVLPPLQQLYVEVLTHVLQNVNLCRNRVVADVIGQDQAILE